MTRTRASARKAGTHFETTIAHYLAEHVDDRIERRTKNGAKDRGDIGGVRLSPALRGGRVVIECKNTSRIALATWAAEAEIERGNDDAVAGLVAHKRHGNAAPGEQWVTMTVDDLIALLTGERPGETDSCPPAPPVSNEKQTGVRGRSRDDSDALRRSERGEG